jgi:hypothetical protein
MFIAILSVKLKRKTYVQIHKMAVKYWDMIAEGFDLTPISERQLRERLKKILHFPGKPVRLSYSGEESNERARLGWIRPYTKKS